MQYTCVILCTYLYLCHKIIRDNNLKTIKMNKITVTIEDFKQLNKMMVEVEALEEKSVINDGYRFHFNGKEDIIEAKHLSINNNIIIMSHLLELHPDMIISMINDLDFAREVLNA